MTKSTAIAVFLVVIAPLVGAVIGVAVGWQWVVFALVLLAGSAIFVLPTDWLPALALVCFALVPIEYLPIQSFSGTLNPGSVVMTVWGFRVLLHARIVRQSIQTALPVACLLVWTVVAVIASVRVQTSVLWATSFATLVVLPALLLPSCPAAATRVVKTWVNLGAALGLYGLVEWALGWNPIFSLIPEAPNLMEAQRSGVYRITTTLGHPLINGTFFSVAFVIALYGLLKSPTKRNLIYAALAVIGVAGTASRGAVLGAGVGAIVVIVASLINPASRVSSKGGFLLLTLFGLAVPLVYYYLGQRAATGNTAGSTDVRLATYQVGLDLARNYWPKGAGPGLADDLKRAYFVGNQERGIESSWLQIAVSLGAPGLGLWLWSLIAGVVCAFRRQIFLAGGLLAYIVGASFYNLLEGSRPALIMLGLLLGSVVSHVDVRSVFSSSVRGAASASGGAFPLAGLRPSPVLSGDVPGGIGLHTRPTHG